MSNYLCRFFGLAMAVLLTLSTLSGCNDGSTSGAVSTKVYDSNAFPTDEIENGIIAQNSSFSVEWNNDEKRVVINDLKNGNLYSTTPSSALTEVYYDEFGMPIKNNPMIESAVAVTYFDSESLEEKTLYSYNDAVQDGNVYAESLENGIRVIYNFAEYEISVAVDYTIKEDSFNISVEPSEISDNTTYIATGVSIAPFICGIKNDTKDSYLFVPDGSGAIIKPKTFDSIGSLGSIDVYGGDYSTNDFLYESYTEQCYMPVFGVKSGNSGIFAIIDSAAERSSINWNVGSSNIRYSSVYPHFEIRGYNTVSQPGGFGSFPSKIKVFNEYVTDETLSVSYYPLYGEDCGYEDMAKIYQKYLVDVYGLSEKENSEVELSLEIEGGMLERKFFCGIPYQGVTTLTSIVQAQEIAEYFGNETDNLLVRLCGFTQSGLDVGDVAGGFKINSEFGSKSKIKELTEFCKESNIVLSLDFDVVSFNNNSNGYSVKKSSALFPDYKPNTVSLYDYVTRNEIDTKYFLLKRSLIPSVLDKVTNKIDDYGFESVGLGTLGKLIYSDFSSVDTYSCNNIQENIISEINELSKTKNVIMTGANDYTASVCSYIVDAPINSSKYDIFDYDIPFYSLVFKGFVPMSSGAVNLAADEKTTLLKCIESGISPTYTLIYDFPREAVTSNYVVTSASEYMSIREKIIKNVSDMKSVFSAISGAKISSHKVISKDLRLVKYDNGTSVYVNYGDTDISVNGVSIAAKDFVVIGG